MVIEINKDIDRYQESVVMGLSAKQFIFSIISVAAGGGLIVMLYRYIGLTASAYVAIPVVAPIALGGFYSYNGMSFYEVMGKKFHYMFGNKTLTYVSTEGEPAIKAYEQKRTNEKRAQAKKGREVCSADTSKGDKEEFEAMKKKMKMTIITVAVGLITLLAGVAAYKFTY